MDDQLSKGHTPPHIWEFQGFRCMMARSGAGNPSAPHGKVVVLMMYNWYGMPWMSGYGTGAGLFMMFLLIVVIVVIVILVVWALRHKDTQHHGTMYPGNPVPPIAPTPPQDDPACGTARLRYAKGEISKEELDEICSTLKGK